MKKYDEEFKAEAIRKIFEGQSVSSVSRETGVSENQLHKWKKEKVETSTDAEKEVLRLRKKLREVEMENEILKKAALIFGRGS
jgi:transposase